MNLENAIVYDVECLVNCFTLSMELLNQPICSTWEISQFRDDRQQLFEWFNYLQTTQTPMIGFNSESYDYAMIHFIYTHPNCSYADIYAKNEAYFESQRGANRFAHTIWARDRFAPQIDLYKIHHMDNRAKTTSLKALQINMRAETVVDSPVEFGTVLTEHQVNSDLIPYNKHDVKETKRFAHFSKPAIDFRIGLIPQFGIEVLNYNDTKIGEKMLEQRLGEDVCYRRVPRYDGDTIGRKEKRQTPRSRIALADIIFPYIKFENPEFQRVLDYMRQQVLTPDDLEDPNATIKTKGVFTGLTANVGGVSFEFGTGGIHASVRQKRFEAGGGWLIRDIDVASLYPNIGIVNKLAPEHLGAAFVEAYAQLPKERKEWQLRKGKKCVEANTMKLGGNGAYGKSNDKYSFLYDPKYTMTVTINGQLMLCMLAEKLATVPTLQIIQVNTDGITYRIHEDYEPLAKQYCREWEVYTLLTLEDADYNRMWIADVNTYLAEPVVPVGSNEPPVYKQKGRLWHPASGDDYAKSISECQPPAWHKDLGNVVSIKAAVAAMLHGVDPEAFIRCHNDPFDFMCRVKVDRASRLMLGDRQIQSTTRYYVANSGEALVKISPPKGTPGEFKRANKLTDSYFNAVMKEIGPGVWDERIHTKNKGRYEEVRTGIEAGWKIAECNDARSFTFANVNYDYYVAEARKLIIA